MTEGEAAAGVVDPWRHETDDVAAAVRTDVDRGLGSAEAAERLERLGPNRLEQDEDVAAWRRFLGQFANPLIYLLLAATAIALAAWAVEGREGIPFDAIAILAIVLLNAVLGYVLHDVADHVGERQRDRRAVGEGTVVDVHLRQGQDFA